MSSVAEARASGSRRLPTGNAPWPGRVFLARRLGYRQPASGSSRRSPRNGACSSLRPTRPAAPSPAGPPSSARTSSASRYTFDEHLARLQVDQGEFVRVVPARGHQGRLRVRRGQDVQRQVRQRDLPTRRADRPAVRQEETPGVRAGEARASGPGQGRVRGDEDCGEHERQSRGTVGFSAPGTARVGWGRDRIGPMVPRPCAVVQCLFDEAPCSPGVDPSAWRLAERCRGGPPVRGRLRFRPASRSGSIPARAASTTSPRSWAAASP